MAIQVAWCLPGEWLSYVLLVDWTFLVLGSAAPQQPLSLVATSPNGTLARL